MTSLSFGCFGSYENSSTMPRAWHTKNSVRLAALATATITKLYEFENKILWAATPDKVYSFDGAKIQNHEVAWEISSPYPTEKVAGFFQASLGKAFFVSYHHHIYTLDRDTNRFTNIRQDFALPGESTTDAFLPTSAPAGFVTISSGRPFFFDAALERQTEIVDLTAGESEDARAVAQIENGDILVIYGSGRVTQFTWKAQFGWYPIARFSCRGTGSPLGAFLHLKENSFANVNPDSQIVFADLSSRGCEFFAPDQELSIALRDKMIRSLHVFPRSNQLGIATDKGLLVYSPGNISVINKQNTSLRSSNVTSAIEVGSGELIIGTFLGANEAYQSGVSVFSSLLGERFPEITGISEYEDGRFLVTSYTRIYTISGTKSGWTVAEVPAQYIDGGISASTYANGSIFLGTVSGELIISSFEGDVTCVVSSPLSPGYPVTGIALEDGFIVASNLKGELVRTRPADSCSASVVPMGTPPNPGSPIISLDKVGRSLFAFDFEGAFAVRDLDMSSNDHLFGNLRAVRPKISHVWLMDQIDKTFVMAKPDGRLYFSDSLDGSDKSTAYAIDEPIFGLEVDDKSRAWLATNKGLWISNVDRAPALVLPSSQLSDVSFDYKISLTSSDGWLLFGGTGGMVIIQDPSFFPVRASGRIRLDNIRINRADVFSGEPPSGTTIHLSGTDHRLTFRVLPPLMIDSRIAGIEARVLPGNREWIDIGVDGLFRTTRLPPGTYTFQARGADALGVWSENEISVPIVVQAPPWQRPWALLAYLIGAVAVVLLIRRHNQVSLERRVRLAQAADDAAEVRRLQDECQEERDANDRLVRAISQTSSELIGAFRQLLESQSAPASVATAPWSERGVVTTAMSSEDRLTALEIQQRLCQRTSAGDRCDLHAVVEELTATLVERHPVFGRYIVLNDVSQAPCPSRHGQYLALVLHEMLWLMLADPEPADSHPVVQVSLETPTSDASTGDAYRISVSCAQRMPLDEYELEGKLPLTLQLIESFGGDFGRGESLGCEIQVSLRLS